MRNVDHSCRWRQVFLEVGLRGERRETVICIPVPSRMLPIILFLLAVLSFPAQASPEAAKNTPAGITSVITTWDGHSVVLKDFHGDYRGEMGSDSWLELLTGDIKRQIPYREMKSIEFDKSLGEKWYEFPRVVRKDGSPVALQKDERANFWIRSEVWGIGDTGDKIAVPIRSIKSIEFRE